MKAMKYLSMVLLMLVTSVCMFSCSDDDEPEQPTSSDNIIGVWVTTGDPYYATTYEFRNDGTGVITNISGSTNIRYTYSSTEKILKLWAVNDDIVYNYSVQQTGNTLMLSDGDGLILVLERR